MKYRARCRVWACQARRTIKGIYDREDEESCHRDGCKGKMRWDKVRNRLGSNDGRELCYCDGYEMSQRNCPHRKGSKNCEHYEDMVIERSLTTNPDRKQKDDEPFW